jgi:hypothetical protein
VIEVMMRGLDGANPLAFLAALGVLRTLAEARPDRAVKIGWRLEDVWHPYIFADGPLSEDVIVDILDRQLRAPGADEPFVVAPDLKLVVGQFRTWGVSAVEAGGLDRRRFADFVAAFGSDAIVNDDVVADTAFRTMSGAGHQHFLATMALLVATTTREHLRKALYQRWQYDDPLEKRTLRWDPLDDRRHATRWSDPSTDSTRRERGAVQGANRLAVEGLSLFPTAPVNRRLATVGFTGTSADATFLKYPIWTSRLNVDVVRSVLGLETLRNAEDAKTREMLTRFGIAEVFRCQRITEGKFRNFSPSIAL